MCVLKVRNWSDLTTVLIAKGILWSTYLLLHINFRLFYRQRLSLLIVDIKYFHERDAQNYRELQ